MLKDVYTNAKSKMTLCKMCPICNGEACRGRIPGPGGKGSGQSFVNNIKGLKNLSLNMKVIREDYDVDCRYDYFGHTLQAPIFIAPMASVKGHFGCELEEQDFVNALGDGAKQANLLSFFGDGAHPTFFGSGSNYVNAHQFGVCTIKPWSMSIVKEKLDSVINNSQYGIAMDVDAAGLVFLKKTATPIEFKTVQNLKEIRSWIKGPFIIKGVMTVDDAASALEAKADAIIVSNHGGRVMDDGSGTVEVLEEIVKFVDKRMKVFTDGGYRTGFDVFKALALGADAVLVGRPFAHAAIGGQSEGVVELANQLAEELRDAMRLTACQRLKDIKRSCIKI